MPAHESSLKIYFMGIFSSKIVYQKCVTRWKQKEYCQLCIDYESNKFILKFFSKK